MVSNSVSLGFKIHVLTSLSHEKNAFEVGVLSVTFYA